jgi:poly(3-hydroxybutyrate) depolymerase
MSIDRHLALVPALFVLLAACSSDDAKESPNPQGGAGGSGSPGDSGSGGAEPAPFEPPVADDCITSPVAGHQQLTCDGLVFELNVGESCLTQACGLIMDVHGFGMNGPLMEGHTKLAALATSEGYIVVQPSAPGAILTSAWNNTHDELVYKIMHRVIDVFHVDRKRVHFDGYSMGGWMTWRFICKHSDELASAAPIAAGAGPVGNSCAFAGEEMPAREIPIFYTHGRTDGLVPFTGAVTERDALLAAWYPGVSPTVVAEASDYKWERWTNANGAVFEFAQHDWTCDFVLGATQLKGHCFPGSEHKPIVGCGTDNAFNWGQEVLKFFKAHPMK